MCRSKSKAREGRVVVREGGRSLCIRTTDDEERGREGGREGGERDEIGLGENTNKKTDNNEID